MDWQPIDTAPKDGSAILIYQPNDHHFGLRERHYRDDKTFSEFDDLRFAIGYWRPWGKGGWGNRNQSEVNPTHWMPLPEPPQ